MNNQECPNCSANFEPTKEQKQFIAESRRKDMMFIIVECSSCETTFPYELSKEESAKEEIKNELFRTPVAGAKGYVSIVNMGSQQFYGCNETGALWDSLKKLYKDVEGIIKKYPHRAECYTKTKEGWEANKNEPSDIIEKIKGEE